MKSPEEKYYNDNHYKTLVDVMVNHIRQCNFTPSEMREAAILASIIYERNRIRNIEVPEHIENHLQELNKWIGNENQKKNHRKA